MSAPAGWKPGDIAMVSYGFEEERMMRDHSGWFSASTEISDGDHMFDSARPLVVIDPEDREQVDRLTRIIFGPLASAAGDVAGYLREFASPTPPRPDEPTGLGAVVEDADGDRFVRVVSGPSNAYWHCTTNSEGDERWPDIAVVKVLSEGVTE
jgi:hypothetical protein